MKSKNLEIDLIALVIFYKFEKKSIYKNIISNNKCLRKLRLM